MSEELTPTSTTRRWVDPDDKSQWAVTFRWGPVGPAGTVECVGLELRSVPVPVERLGHEDPLTSWRDVKPQPVTTSRLRRLNLATLVAQEKAALGQRISAALPAIDEASARAGTVAREICAELTTAAATRPRGGQTGRPARYGREHFEEVARVYRENYSGLTSTPTKAVAEHFGVTSATAKKWVSRTRQMGMLGPTEPGRAGGTEPRRRRR